MPWRENVVVIGGGPAGCATAIELAWRGVEVALLDRESVLRPRPGETLPPSAKPALAALGLWERFLEDSHLASFGVTSYWEDQRPTEKDFLFDPHGHGWHLDRTSFDQMLRRAASEAGVRILPGVAVRRLSRNRSGTWWIDTADRDKSLDSIDASFVVCAANRSSVLRSATGPRRSLDRLVGIVAIYRRTANSPACEPRLLVEAVPDGWWYSAPLPGDRLVVALMTDADLIVGGVAASFHAALEGARHTRDRLRRSLVLHAPRAYPAETGRASLIAGSGYLAVGDAAMTWDPLSGRGILKALITAPIAAEAIARARGGNAQALDDYAEGIANEFETYQVQRTAVYQRQGRWPDAPFWARRAAAISTRG